MCAGFYDTSQDTHEKLKPDFAQLRLHELDEEDKRQKERMARKQDKEKIANRKKDDLPGYLLGGKSARYFPF